MPSRPGVTTKEVALMCAVLLCIIIMACGLEIGLSISVLGHLFLGWAFFLYRVLPGISLSWVGVATTLLCLGLLSFGLHRFSNGFYAQVQKRRQVETIQPWRWRWTVSLLAVIVLMFVAGIAAVGIVHQTVWLVTAPEPILEWEKRSTFIPPPHMEPAGSSTKPAAPASGTKPK
jgi:hypothetical protein